MPAQQPKLPFSPDELREALKAPPVVQKKPEPPKHEEIHEAISHEIVAFESALRDVHHVKTPAPESRPKQAAVAPPQAVPEPLDEGMMAELQENPLFFHEFSQFLTRENLAAEGVLGQDILFRMKEFHRHRQEGKEYYLYSKDVQAAVRRKVEELKTLEQEWFIKQVKLDELQKELRTIEHDIEARTADLKNLVHQANKKSKFEHAVPEGHEFLLRDGRKLSNLLDLKVALHTMPDTVFGHHVNHTKHDFAAWVRGAMNDPELADQISRIHDKAQLEVFLSKLSS